MDSPRFNGLKRHQNYAIFQICFASYEIRSNLTSNVLFSFMGGNQNHQSRKSLYFLNGGALHLSVFFPNRNCLKPTNSNCLLENGALKGPAFPTGATQPRRVSDVPHIWGGDCAWPNPQRESSIWHLDRPIGLCGCFQKLGVPQNGWFIVENPIKMDDLGVPLFSETSVWSCE